MTVRFSTMLVLVLCLAGCRCAGPLDMVGEDALRVEPARLDFSPTFVGASSRLTLRVDNPSRTRRAVTATVDGAFSVSPSELELAGGESTELVVTFTPVADREVSAVLQVNTVAVEVSGSGLPPLTCEPSRPCVDIRFGAESGACVTTTAADGTSCETGCVDGQCVNGECIGALKNCPDTVCTVGVCSEAAGCSHVPRMCPAAPGPCQEASCDDASGCGFTDKIDGTLCGPDDCRVSSVDVCISGTCTSRARPATGRCTNTWLPLNASPHEASVAWDPTTRETLMLGSAPRSTNTTWGWDGQRWSLHLPPATPPDRERYQLVTDTQRNTVLLFGGQGFNDTWEWDGATWRERRPTTSPPTRVGFAMAFDERRGRAVLFGGLATGHLDDTWEWDGRNWLEMHPAHKPAARQFHAMAWDPLRRRVLMFGGTNDFSFHQQLADTWEWDGGDWVQRSSGGVPMRAFHGMTWDPIGSVMLAFGGYTGDANANSTIAWDGTSWTTRVTPQPPPFANGAILATDLHRNRAVMVNDGVWEWDGNVWVERAARPSPYYQPMFFDSVAMQLTTVTYRETWQWGGSTWNLSGATTEPNFSGSLSSLGYDPVRQRGVGTSTNQRDGGTETWEYDGQAWSQRPTPVTPRFVGRTVTETIWDTSRNRLVLFGGAPTASTWEWDGTTWVNAPQLDGPANRSGNGLAWDSKRNRAVLFGGGVGLTPINDTWERVGTQWVQQQVTVAPQVRPPATLAYDPVRERTLLFANELTTNAAETWEWDGSTWTRLSPAVSPPPANYGNPEYFGHLMYDPISARVVLLRDGTMWRFEP